MASSDLSTLLQTLHVKQHEGVWRFETIPAEQATWADLISLRSARDIAMLFMEDEGPTLILKAEEDTPEDNRWHWLELAVFSDLHAVGFIAAVAKALASAGVPCNTVAGFHHDHVFVPIGKTSEALAAIEALKQVG